MLNFKLFFKYVLFKVNYAFVNNLAQREKATNLCIDASALYFTCIHLKMASSFYSTQLCDIFAYEILTPKAKNVSNLNQTSTKYNLLDKSCSAITVYNFHSLHSQNRFFIFVQNGTTALHSKHLSTNYSIDSVAELFPAANWLEREVAELNGIAFAGKKDLRNLMLQYGDSTSPFQKSFPSIGVKELFYSATKDTLVQNHVSVQL